MSAVIAAGALVASLILLPLAISRLTALRSTQSWLLAHGTRTTAIVEKVNQVGGEVCAVYDIRFIARDGRSVQIHGFEVHPEADPHRGEQITIAYDPSRPTLLRTVAPPCGDRYGQWHLWAAIVVSGLVMLGAIAVILMAWRRRLSPNPLG